MPTETKYMLAWVVAALLFIALIISLWIVNAHRFEATASYGLPSNTGALQSPHTPFIVAENRQAVGVNAIAQDLPDATRFAALLGSTGVVRMLDPTKPYTLFIPTDRALRALPASTLSSMTASELKRLVEYHVVVGRAIDVNAVDSGSITALSKDTLNFTVTPGDQSARVNSSAILQAYKGKNGIVYLINDVLLPPVGQQP
jgi:uncharacterized surface protein with fasciclin (FAS1) repeats